MSPQHEAHQLIGPIEPDTGLRLVAEPISAAAVAAQEVNARIAAVAQTLTVNGDDASYMFFCECGCLQPVPLTLAGYAAAAGALRAGHALDD